MGISGNNMENKYPFNNQTLYDYLDELIASPVPVLKTGDSVEKLEKIIELLQEEITERKNNEYIEQAIQLLRWELLDQFQENQKKGNHEQTSKVSNQTSNPQEDPRSDH